MPGIEANAFIPTPAQTAEANATNQQTMLNNFQMFANIQAGRAMQRHLNPDGSVDIPGFAQDVRSNKMLAPFLPEILGQAQKYQQSSVLTQTNTQTLASQEYGRLDALAASVDTNSPTASADMTSVMDQARRMGLAGVDAYIGNHPDLARLIGQATERGGNEAERAQNIGTVGSVTVPGLGVQQVKTTISPGGASAETVGGNAGLLHAQVSPSEIANISGQSVEEVDQNTGEKHQGVLGDYVSVDPATGQVTWKDGKSHILTALGPASQATLAAMGTAYGQDISNFETQVVPAAQQAQNSSEQLRMDASKFDYNPNSDFWTKLGEYAKGYNVPVPAFLSGDATGARQAYTKVMQDIVTAQQQRLGLSATDLQRTRADLSSPSFQTTPEGRQAMMAMVEGNADAIVAAGRAWQQQKQRYGAGTWGQFRSEFLDKVPLSVFQAQYMPQADLKTLLHGPPSKAWQRSYDLAKQQGWLPHAQ